MKKKTVENLNEKALELLTRLKANTDVLQKNGQDVTFIKTLELSFRKIVKIVKEIVAQKERLILKKETLDVERKLILELLEDAKKIAKKELGKEPKQEKKKKTGKKDKKQNTVEVIETT